MSDNKVNEAGKDCGHEAYKNAGELPPGVHLKNGNTVVYEMSEVMECVGTCRVVECVEICRLEPADFYVLVGKVDDRYLAIIFPPCKGCGDTHPEAVQALIQNLRKTADSIENLFSTVVEATKPKKVQLITKH